MKLAVGHARRSGCEGTDLARSPRALLAEQKHGHRVEFESFGLQFKLARGNVLLKYSPLPVFIPARIDAEGFVDFGPSRRGELFGLLFGEMILTVVLAAY